MAIKLEKGQKINLEKEDGKSLENFCIGCNWGAIEKETKGLFGFGKRTKLEDVDLDLSCIVTDKNGKMIDHIYSPEYRKEFLANYNLLEGKLDTKDRALHHSGDDRKGDQGGNDGLDNEIITVNLKNVSPDAEQIFFFLNNVGPEDFSQIPYASIRMYDGTPEKVKEIFATYDVAATPQYSGKRALIMAKLYRRDGKWRFSAIGDPTNDLNIAETISTIIQKYAG